MAESIEGSDSSSDRVGLVRGEGSSPVIYGSTEGQDPSQVLLNSSSTYARLHNNNDQKNGINDDSYVTVSINGIEDDASMSLDLCEKWVVRPYKFLLQVVGWRPFQGGNYCTLINWLYPALIFIMLTLACVAQILTCFSRTNSTPPFKVNSTRNNDSSYYILRCESHIATLNVLPYILKLTGYLWALYVFRIVNPDNLSNLANTVFLSFNDVMASRSRRRPVIILISIFVFGVAYFVLSATFSVIRMIGFKLYSSHTIIGWFAPSNITEAIQDNDIETGIYGSEALHYFLWIFAYCGFVFFDLLYVAVTINYCSQCQLLTFLIDNIIDKVRNNKFRNLYEAAKEIRKLDEFFTFLNGNISMVVNLVVYTFLANVILSYMDLTRVEKVNLSIAIGFLNLFQWVMISVVPIVMATRSTASCNELRRLGQEIAVRPFYYAETPDLELQFFLSFTQSTKYQVNLAFIPMQPPFVYGSLFVILVLISSGIVIPQVQSVTWI